MSLFKAREWWSTVVGNNEEFDQGCLCVANVDNSSTEQDKIIVGSYMGFLRIYNPHPIKPGDAMQPEDLLLEVQLREPILQVEVGKFVSGTELLHLAVLHCKKLVVYAVSGNLGNIEHGNQYQLKRMYEHTLQRTAFNMTYGPFGGIRDSAFETLRQSGIYILHVAGVSPWWLQDTPACGQLILSSHCAHGSLLHKTYSSQDDGPLLVIPSILVIKWKRKIEYLIHTPLLLSCLGRDLICIQSVDGMLMLFEQESYSFGRFLPGFLLPGPLTYSSRTDSFITVSSCRQVESYKYEVLAFAKDAETQETEQQKLGSGKRLVVILLVHMDSQ
ncbi:hypothetical protein JD844_002669 [Phrynosoma platyrhinos]|uniref:PTHB1 N-terminal domain-containing protein n=1 Tax=Phrynosoma platyrhinos TaxID=52577 RepID=A0ABQ7TBS6_PHRPL|nr:hypothetical protein JD844_002669 [Phrynosoma platyrhinos]